jgi:hypothetical protein
MSGSLLGDATMKPEIRPPKAQAPSIAFPTEDKIRQERCPSVTAASARLTYLRLLDFRDSYGLLDHLGSDGFDYWSDRLFHFPRSLLHWRGLGLGLCKCIRLSSLACLTAFY